MLLQFRRSAVVSYTLAMSAFEKEQLFLNFYVFFEGKGVNIVRQH